jgi:hypothetical protein
LQTRIDEATFHIEGMRSLILALSYEPPKTDPNILRTMAYSLTAMIERRAILLAVRDVDA